MGAYPIGAFLPTTTQEMLAGVYAIREVACRGRSVVTNATPVAPYRGAGRPEATALIERAIDLVAAELGMDPVEVRRENLIPADAFPYETASGTVYDVGDYDGALDEALRSAGIDALRAEQAARRARGDHLELGIGVGTYVEITSFMSKEFGAVRCTTTARSRCRPARRRTARATRPRSRRSRRRCWACRSTRSTVVHSDTGVVRRGAGTWGSRSLQAGGSSVLERSQEVVAKARAVRGASARGRRGRPRRWAMTAWGWPARRSRTITLGGAGRGRRPTRRGCPAGMEPGLRAEGVYREPSSTFPFGAHVAVVEVDTETGDVRLVRHIAVDDCGRVLNPMLVEGQVHGGLAQGIAQALYEEVRYDESGNPMTGNLTTYLMPSAAEFPWFETERTRDADPREPAGRQGDRRVGHDRVDPGGAERRGRRAGSRSASATWTCRCLPSASGRRSTREPSVTRPGA